MANGNGGPPSPRPGGPPGVRPPMKKSTKNWLIIGGVGAAGIVIWYIMRARSQTGTGTTDPNIDPATGVPYSEEYGGYGVGGGPYAFGYNDPGTGAYITGTQAVTQPSTNASWAQQVEAYLQQIGYDPTAVGAALGKYLTGQTLSSDQQGIVAAALGFFGQPPQGAPNPVTTPPPGQVPKSYARLGVTKNETLAQFAKEHNWSTRTLDLVEAINNLKPGSRLRRGERIIRPEWN